MGQWRTIMFVKDREAWLLYKSSFLCLVAKYQASWPIKNRQTKKNVPLKKHLCASLQKALRTASHEKSVCTHKNSRHRKSTHEMHKLNCKPLHQASYPLAQFHQNNHSYSSLHNEIVTRFHATFTLPHTGTMRESCCHCSCAQSNQACMHDRNVVLTLR